MYPSVPPLGVVTSGFESEKGEIDSWLFLAPGKETLNEARRERGKAHADRKGLTAEGVPDSEMLEWLQLWDDEQKEKNGGNGTQLELVLVMMDWEV